MNPTPAELQTQLAQSGLDAKTVERILNWTSEPRISESERSEVLQSIAAQDWGHLQDAFFQELEFGTGGLRGIVGQGSNRMNRVVIQRVTQGLSAYVKENFDTPLHRAAIAYHSRISSQPFAESVAGILAANGIKVFLFPSFETTPCLSFAIRFLGCATGICLTASHNPPEYAGFKVYGPDGAQLISPADKQLLSAVQKILSLDQVQTTPLDKARAEGLIEDVPKEVTAAYDAAVHKLSLLKEGSRELACAYTPLHGTGAVPAQRIMTQWGFSKFKIVPSQEKPDGHFPTVSKPNPEEPEALKELIKTATEIEADVGFATDPDSDRLALVSRESPKLRSLFSDQSHEKYVLLNGNQTGALMIDFLLSELCRQKRLPTGAAVVKTIVTSELLAKICEHHGVSIHNTLTGFKWIAALVRQWEESGAPHQYIFGTEESFGYMPGAYVRDKDGIAAMALCAEMCEHFKNQGTSACAHLLQLFSRFGAWHERLHTIEMKGHTGKTLINRIMTAFRSPAGRPRSLAGQQVVSIEDYQNSTVLHVNPEGQMTPSGTLDLPTSNVLIFRLADGGQVSMRPSGTEPKIKFYLSAQEDTADTEELIAESYQRAKNKTLSYLNELTRLCDELIA